MSTIKSSAEDLTLNADGSNEVKFQINAVEKASINSSGLFTSTTIDATALTGNLPAISGASLTSLPSHSGNVAFPATQVASADANTLDDYEEGTWTPQLEDGSNNATMAGACYGYYTKIGRLVTIWTFTETTSLGSVSGAIKISGLPFANGGNHLPVFAAGAMNLALPGAGQGLAGYILNSSDDITLWIWDATAGGTTMQATEWSADGGSYLQSTYSV